MPSLLSRVEKLEVSGNRATAPKWLFISMIDGKDISRIMSIQDINHHTQLGSYRHHDNITQEEFLNEATEYFGIDMHRVWDDEHEVIEIN